MHDNHHLQYCRTRAYSTVQSRQYLSLCATVLYNCTTCSIVAPCETKCAGCGFIGKKLGAYWPKALMVHLYHIFSGWFSVLISCIHAAKPYLDSEPFSWWYIHKRLPMAAETMALLIARQHGSQKMSRRQKRRWNGYGD